MRARRVRVPSLLGDMPGMGGAPEPPPEEPVRRRFLFAVPPVAGNVGPAAAVAAELTARGHRVTWTGPKARLEAVLPPGARVLHADGVEPPAATHALRGPAALRSLWEDVLVPLGHAMLPGVQAAIDRFRPDVVVSDQQILAAPVAARLRGLPWATLAPTSAEFTRPLAAFPAVEGWVRDLIGDFQDEHGIEDLIDLRFSDHLVLVFSTGALIGDVSFFPDHIAFVGPASHRALDTDFPWDALDDDRPLVPIWLGSHGTAGEPGRRFLRAAVQAAAGLDAQVVVAAPGKALGAVPDGVVARPRVPLAALLERSAAFVTNGGHTAVGEALTHGVPMVVAPVRDDQPVVAGQIEAAGAGVRLRLGRVTADDIRDALFDVLSDDAYRTAAGTVRDAFAEAGGAGAAADRLEKLT
ncbi:glycosyltransferase [Actinomadura flavalba]|uniref:glycosyltransferase n=1 Tax=Actinomadura flavalba TaxID=1120938 RepID=UPI0012DD3D02|nr:nucleotide disphospho-sugar-binding domain-containing protein [Actinomadura flavalba]